MIDVADCALNVRRVCAEFRDQDTCVRAVNEDLDKVFRRIRVVGKMVGDLLERLRQDDGHVRERIGQLEYVLRSWRLCCRVLSD
jgi:hypothetical protein